MKLTEILPHQKIFRDPTPSFVGVDPFPFFWSALQQYNSQTSRLQMIPFALKIQEHFKIQQRPHRSLKKIAALQRCNFSKRVDADR